MKKAIPLIFAGALFFTSCTSGTLSYTPCEERCRYMELDCRNACGPDSINFGMSYGRGSIEGISSCQERCSSMFDRCMAGCSLEKGDGE